MKHLMVILVVLLVLLGIPYGLAKVGVIPVAKLTANNPGLAKFAQTLGLVPRKRVVHANSQTKEPVPPSQITAPPRPPTPLHNPPPTATPLSPVAAQEQPNRQIGWMAKVYENMEPEEAVRIFANMDDREVVSLLRRMKQRQVAAILALMPPDRAARLTRSLMIQR